MAMLRPKRKETLESFQTKNNLLTIVFLTALFISGLIISLTLKLPGAAAYIILWVLSYFVLFSGACKHCVYYGRKCPIPLEGSCVHVFFKKGGEAFGFKALFWATIAYVLRVSIPVYLIFSHKLIIPGIIYFSILTVFWVIHLRFTGCPNCINYQCPLNPGQTH